MPRGSCLVDWRRQPGRPHVTWHRIWNNITLCSPKQQIWHRTALCGRRCRYMALRNLRVACQKGWQWWCPLPYFHLATSEMWCWSRGRGILTKLFLCYTSGAQRYEQFLRIGQLYQACLVYLSVFEASLCLRSYTCYIYMVTSFLYLSVSLAWWDWPLTWLTNHFPSVLWHCWLGHATHKIVSKMIDNVSIGTLNPTIPYRSVVLSVMAVYIWCDNLLLFFFLEWLSVAVVFTWQHDTLLSRFVEVMKDFNMQQVKYRESCRERIQRQLKISK